MDNDMKISSGEFYLLSTVSRTTYFPETSLWTDDYSSPLQLLLRLQLLQTEVSLQPRILPQ